jgi:hypothetical protein
MFSKKERLLTRSRGWYPLRNISGKTIRSDPLFSASLALVKTHSEFRLIPPTVGFDWTKEIFS